MGKGFVYSAHSLLYYQCLEYAQSIFAFFFFNFFFFLMWTTFKVFTEFVTILFLFCFGFLGAQDKCDLTLSLAVK